MGQTSLCGARNMSALNLSEATNGDRAGERTVEVTLRLIGRGDPRRASVPVGAAVNLPVAWSGAPVCFQTFTVPLGGLTMAGNT